MVRKNKPAPPTDTKVLPTYERSDSIPSFCIAEGISLTSYYKMRKTGHGPVELRIPGTAIVRITPESRRQWHERMAQLQTTEEAKLEVKRRSEVTSRKGKMAIASPAHIANVRRRRA